MLYTRSQKLAKSAKATVTVEADLELQRLMQNVEFMRGESLRQLKLAKEDVTDEERRVEKHRKNLQLHRTSSGQVFTELREALHGPRGSSPSCSGGAPSSVSSPTRVTVPAPGTPASPDVTREKRALPAAPPAST